MSVKVVVWWVIRFLVLPFVYFASILPVVVGVAVAFSSLEYGVFLFDYVEPLYRYDDMTPVIDEIGLVTIFVIGALVFGVCERALVLLEGLRQPKLTDHLRHCSYLYIFFILLSAILIPDYIEGLRLGYPGVETPAQVVWLVAVLAILIDAAALTWHRWRFARIGHGAIS